MVNTYNREIRSLARYFKVSCRKSLNTPIANCHQCFYNNRCPNLLQWHTAGVVLISYFYINPSLSFYVYKFLYQALILQNLNYFYLQKNKGKYPYLFPHCNMNIVYLNYYLKVKSIYKRYSNIFFFYS